MKHAIIMFFVSMATLLGAAPGHAFPPPDSEEAFRRKLEIRGEVKSRAAPPRTPEVAAPEPNDLARNVVDEFRYGSLSAMERANLRGAQVSTQPWSDSYWPIYNLGLANRYADARFPGDLDWSVNERYLAGQLGRGPVEQLSPAEKYDLLVGDASFTLSKRMIEAGRGYYERNGRVESWMGYCHGWAPASYMLARPTNAVTVIAANGRTKILFYPSDVKALATLLWSEGSFQTRFVGGRCNDRNPPRDDNGRPISPECADTNPATWHLAVVNQVGGARRSLVFDTTYDYEVWNQPVYAYRYQYLHHESGAPLPDLSDALRPIDARDPRRSLRAPNATHFVRVQMTVRYLSERFPDTALRDSPVRDVFGNARYDYELELDGDGQIVGGEWRSFAHPDFIWTPVPETRARSVGDLALDRSRDRSSWARGEKVPRVWRRAAIEASRRSQPLARIVERLVRFASVPR